MLTHLCSSGGQVAISSHATDAAFVDVVDYSHGTDHFLDHVLCESKLVKIVW
jgi:hypothetical protein